MYDSTIQTKDDNSTQDGDSNSRCVRGEGRCCAACSVPAMLKFTSIRLRKTELYRRGIIHLQIDWTAHLQQGERSPRTAQMHLECGNTCHEASAKSPMEFHADPCEGEPITWYMIHNTDDKASERDKKKNSVENSPQKIRRHNKPRRRLMEIVKTRIWECYEHPTAGEKYAALNYELKYEEKSKVTEMKKGSGEDRKYGT